MSRKALGRGLDALIPQGVKETLSTERIIRLPVDDIKPNPRQPRKRFDEEKMKALSSSIRQDGLLQPIVVRRHGEQYELIMGERRLQAARLAGVPTVPALVRTADEADTLRLALVENLQREDLNPIEVAEAYRSLTERFGLSQGELADLVGKDRSSVANTLRLLGLPVKIRSLIIEGKIREGHARALLSLPTEAEQISLAEQIVSDRLTVRDAESETSAGKKRKPRARKEKPSHIAFLENAMSSHLSTRVTVEEKRGGKGRIVIEFYSHEDFDRLTEMMNIPIPR
jgi:ParB family chromosome partitioning protein